MFPVECAGRQSRPWRDCPRGVPSLSTVAFNSAASVSTAKSEAELLFRSAAWSSSPTCLQTYFQHFCWTAKILVAASNASTELALRRALRGGVHAVPQHLTEVTLLDAEALHLEATVHGAVVRHVVVEGLLLAHGTIVTGPDLVAAIKDAICPS